MSQAIIISLSLGTGKSGITDLRAQLVDSAGGDVGVAISQGFADMGQGNYQWYCASIPDDFTFGGVKFFSDAAPAVTLASTAISGVDFLPVTGGKIDILSTALSATSRIPDISVPRNATQGIPVVIALHNPDGSALPGQASALSATVTCLDNGLVLDATDNRFRDSPTAPSIPFAPIAVTPHIYLATLSPAGWPRGNYHVRTIRSGTNDEFVSAFSLGLNVKRSLGYSAVYNGTALTLSVWVEEDGVPQTDYTAIQNSQLLNAAGNLITGGDLGNNTSPNNGIFTFTKTLALPAGSNYVFRCTATVPGPDSLNDYQFVLQSGLARP